MTFQNILFQLRTTILTSWHVFIYIYILVINFKNVYLTLKKKDERHFMNTRNEKKAYAHFEFWKIANFRLVRFLFNY